MPKDKCGKDFDHSCLKCGTKSDYDCEECCPGCTPVDKPPYKYCDCSKGPPPGPPPGNDTWTNYSVGPLAVTAVTGGKDASAYDTAVVMLHGGGGSGADWLYQYDAGWLGNLTGFKYVFPTSAYPRTCGSKLLRRRAAGWTTTARTTKPRSRRRRGGWRR